MMSSTPPRPRTARLAARRLPRRLRARRGFTTVELIVAVVILTVGVLGLASTAFFVTRMLGQGTQQSRAAYAAQTRFERLRAVRCPVASGTATQPGGLTERWTVVANAQLNSAASRMYEVVDSVSYKQRGVTKHQVFRTVVQCLQ